MGPVSPGGNCEKRKIPEPGGVSPFITGGAIAQDGGGALQPRRMAQQPVSIVEGPAPCMDGPCQQPTFPRLRHVSTWC